MAIDAQGYSSQVDLYLELDSGRRLSVSQVGRDSLIVADDQGELLAGRMAKLVIVVDGQTDEYDVLLSSYCADTRQVEFA